MAGTLEFPIAWSTVCFRGIHPKINVMLCCQGGYGGRQLTLLAPTNYAIKMAAEANGEKYAQFATQWDVKEC